MRVISFDAGGVLLFPNWNRVSAALASVGVDVTSDELARADPHARLAIDQASRVSSTDNSGHGRAYFDELLLAAGIRDDARLVEAATAVEAEHGRQSLWDLVGPGVYETVEVLRLRGVRMIVVSNSDGRLHGLLAGAGLTPYFDLVIDSLDVGVEKPDPRIFTDALARIGATPSEAVHVGDVYEIDVAGSRAAGMTPVLLDPHDLHLHRDCWRIQSLRELADA